MVAKIWSVRSRGSRVPVVKAPDAREHNDATDAGWFDRPPYGSIAVERHVRPIDVVVGGVAAYEAKQVPRAENHDVIKQLAPQRPDKSLREAVLPWGPWRDRELVNAQVLHPPVESRAVDAVAVPDQAQDVRLPANCFHDLLGCPGRVRVHMTDRRYAEGSSRPCSTQQTDLLKADQSRSGICNGLCSTIEMPDQMCDRDVADLIRPPITLVQTPDHISAKRDRSICNKAIAPMQRRSYTSAAS